MPAAIRRILFALAVVVAGSIAQESRPAFGFSVTVPTAALSTPFTGRVVVFLSQQADEPRRGPNWFRPEPMYAADFAAVAPGAAMIIDDRNAIGFPGKPSALKPGKWNVQAVVDRNLGGRSIGATAGNVYSKTVSLDLDPAKSGVVAIVCDQTIVRRPFKDSDRTKEVRLESKLLSAFYGRPTTINCAVILPKASLASPEQKFPVIYEIPGFGGDHSRAGGSSGDMRTVRDGQPFIRVLLDPSCPGGHCVFADSENNGPWGAALTTELIPHVEAQFRGIGRPEARFVTGHSSGGWSSLWLQVTYPNVFGGCWSTSPDPVDFRDFQRIDLYTKGSNMFVDGSGQPRPLARQGDRVMVTYRQFSDMERPLRGEQLESFEMVFSPKMADGKPRRLWNRDTGEVDTATAETWKKFDIGLTLRTQWKSLAPKLNGKIHVYMGDMDTFYLEGAVKLLKKDLADISADAVVEIVPGDHGSMMTPDLVKRIDKEMAAQFKAHVQ